MILLILKINLVEVKEWGVVDKLVNLFKKNIYSTIFAEYLCFDSAFAVHPFQTSYIQM